MAPQTMAITAGHALVYAVVFGRLSKMVNIASSDHFSRGYMEGENLLDFDTYKLASKRTAVKIVEKRSKS